MSDTVIKIEGLSKQYRLGTVGTGTLSHDLNRWWHKVRGKPDPYLKVTESNDRTASVGDSEYVWALRDINLEIRRGEVLGIIGRNGAGKSTLLKILSRVTAPTQGGIWIKGRIGALLEVGTGFHPELTGRENVYLNGAILGMTKAEIAGKLDQIVEFSGCARYLDTPVKRYSSGMLVRLAFSVAAHLDPEILVVDEVLAVGDLAFQKKCLGKMSDVSDHGRTVLFVSHNMTAIRKLCGRAVVLDQGRVVFNGPTEDAIAVYRSNISSEDEADGSIVINREHYKTASDYRIEKLELLNRDGHPLNQVGTGDFVCIRIHYHLQHALHNPGFGLRFLTADRHPLMRFVNDACGFPLDKLEAGKGWVDCVIERLPFTRGSIIIDADIGVRGSTFFHIVENAVRLDVDEGDYYGSGVPFDSARRHGYFVCEHRWERKG